MNINWKAAILSLLVMDAAVGLIVLSLLYEQFGDIFVGALLSISAVTMFCVIYKIIAEALQR